MNHNKKQFLSQIDQACCKDYRRLRRLLARAFHSEENDAKQLSHFLRELERSQREVEERSRSLPDSRFPHQLPISSKLEEITTAITEHQVVIITGETGSGKTTQIPKMCLKAERGVRGRIACTQPRRIAAASLAKRVAEEIGSQVGELVGCSIRFSSKSSAKTLIEFMTDGILLAAIKTDPFLSDYDTIIIDEAHERTLNIDFLLGYLRQLLTKRRELKLIITSATIDVEKFSASFPQYRRRETNRYYLLNVKPDRGKSRHVNAPIIEVSGRMYPVESRYLPIDAEKEEKGDLTMIDMVKEAVEEILTETSRGDILVFMSGIQEIKEAEDRLGYLQSEGFQVLPLFGRLTIGEQNRIFKKTDARKIILSTNIAETSITIPGIRYVIDTGRARISQYNTRSGTHGLPIKAISQSSADQRKGRCGRVSDGICIRLYSEEDYSLRPTYATPEIQRSDLSDVILRLLDLKLGDIETFSFIDPPDSAQIRSGIRTLRELGALDNRKKLTKTGKEMASLPVDPRTARMILQARREKALYPLLIIASAISCQDPRERPEEKQAHADQKHARFVSRHSDLLTLLNLWEEYHAAFEQLKSQGKMRKFCKTNFLSYNRMREWRDIYHQLLQIAKEKKWTVKQPTTVNYDAIHRSVLAGYLSHIAKRKEKKVYQGTKNREITLFPGSGQYKSRHEWIVAIELIETSRLYAHRVAGINPDWLESLAGDLCRKTWSEPRWEREENRVVAWEKVTLFGFTLIEKRNVNYGSINREESNDIFIRDALVGENFSSELPFWRHNRHLIQSIREKEHQTRKRDYLVAEREIAAFYNERITGVACLDDLKKLIRQHGGDRFLFLSESDILARDPDHDASDFPTHLTIDNYRCQLDYLFEPGHPKDGVTIQLPWTLVNSLREDSFEYLVPGLLKEKIIWLLKNLPKQLRKKLVPIPEKAENIWEEMTSTIYSTEKGGSSLSGSMDSFYQTLSNSLFRLYRVDIPTDQWETRHLPDHLRMNFSVKSPDTQKIRHSRSLGDLRGEREKEGDDWTRLISPHIRHTIDHWDFDSLGEKVPLSEEGDLPLWGYRSLVKTNEGLTLTLKKNSAEAEESNISGVYTLLERELGKELAWIYIDLRFPPETLSRFRLLKNGDQHLSVESLQKKFGSVSNKLESQFHKTIQDESFEMVKNGLLGFNEEPILTKPRYERRLESVQKIAGNIAEQVTDSINKSLDLFFQVADSLRHARTCLDHEHWDALWSEVTFFFPKECLREIPLEQWRHCPRLFKSYLRRIDKCLETRAVDHARQDEVDKYQKITARFCQKKPSNSKESWRQKRLRWMLEELKVSLFSQELKTAFPISAKRIDTFLKSI